jgi:hypothetical protein
MYRGPARYEPRESEAILASSGWQTRAAVSGAVEKRLAETHMRPLTPWLWLVDDLCALGRV